MRRLLLAAAFALAAALPAYAQIAGAIGHPLPSNDLPTGTVSVRVIAGMVTKPVVGTEVQLLVNGTPRSARTDSEGRAQFPDIPPGATVQAKTLDDDKKDVTSEEFPVPEDTGVRVMITTKPFEPPGGGGAPFAGGGMPDPRQASGQPRGESKTPAGELGVLVCYGDLKDVVENIPVTLAGYTWDGKVTITTAQTGKDGHARFADLDRTGGTAYYAMTELPRNGAMDRLISYPVMLDGQVGVAMLLSGDKRDSKSAPIDEFGRYDAQTPTPAGKVRVDLRGLVVGSQQVELYDPQTSRVLAHALPVRGEPDIGNVEPSAQFDDHPDEKPGTFDVTVHGGPRGTDKPLPNIELRMQPAGDDKAEPTVGHSDAEGKAHFELPGGSYTVTLVINDKPLTSQPFDLTKGGMSLAVGATWDTTPHLEAVFDDLGAIDATRTLYVRTLGKGGETDIYRSLPFHIVADRGIVLTLLVAPHVVFSFRMVSEVDDRQLAVRGLLDIENLTWAPYKEGPDGLVIPAPAHFRGGTVAETEAQIAAVDAAHGFRLLHPLSPLRTQFHVGFTLPVNGGDVSWNLDLPFGAYQSEFRVVPFAGMKLDLPPGARAGDVTLEDGTKMYAVQGISIERGKSMQLTIHGLPSEPAWKVWVPRVFGVVVVAMMLGGLGFAFAGRRSQLRRLGSDAAPDPAREARRNRLMDELVELERAGRDSAKDRKRHDALVSELEKLWD